MGVESYKAELMKKCKSTILDDCSQKTSSIEALQTCMFARFPELNGTCSMFLFNAQITYPPLAEDKIVGGISLPKGTIFSTDSLLDQIY